MSNPIKLLGLMSFMLLTQAQAADLSGVKNYLLGNVKTQVAGTAQLQAAADAYYELARSKGFDYARVAKDPRTLGLLQQARIGWKKASPAYENVEGIVAGVESLSEFDLILDAGVAGSEGGEDTVPFDLTLPNGKVLRRPGNLFGVTEGSLWGTEKAFSSRVPFDVNRNGQLEFGELLPDAAVLKAAASKLHAESVRLQRAAQAWTPTRADVFGALAGNVPTVGPVFFEDWKTSRFILGDAANRRDFMVISRLSDLSGNISSWQAMYRGLSPDVRAKDPQLDAQISAGLNDLAAFVRRLVSREAQRRYTPEQAAALQREAQNRATAITGKITQAAALLGTPLQ
ncbi:imelysin family protein [Deinococcus lacus]|uniref:Imelysin family protein n=1 Tax=Deinococcus lacus TaxID=392561 RepID=A0ABW1YEZ8_9DEIO